MQHFLAGVETVFARGIRKGGEGAQGRVARARFHQLGSVHGDVVLPVGPGAFVARDLWWTDPDPSGRGTATPHQCASLLGAAGGGKRVLAPVFSARAADSLAP